MRNKNDGYLLLESLLAMFILTVGILFLFETLVFLRQQEQSMQDELELAIFAKEWYQATNFSDHKAILEKAENYQINITESSENHFIIQKNGNILEIQKKK